MNSRLYGNSIMVRRGRIAGFGLVLLLLLVAAVPSQVWAATGDETTVGSLSLYPSIENIAVVSSFGGDANGNNQARLEYRKAGTTEWKPGIQMTADRRDNLVLFGSGSIANPYKNQWRAVIFWLTPNTSYNVRVTYSDADGVIGTNPVMSTITTLKDNPPSIGKTYFVAKTGSDTTGDGSLLKPWLTIGKAASKVAAGDTVKIKPGTYSEQVILSKSGTASNYVTFRSYDPGNKAIVVSELPGTFRLTGISYNRLKDLDIRNTALSGVLIERSSSNGNIVEDCNLSGSGATWWAGGVVCDGPTNTLIQRNQISTTVTAGVDGPFGVLLNETGGGTVVRDNQITGGFEDGIGGAPNSAVNGGPYQNSYIYRNTIDGANHDGIEAEGGGINVGIWGNTIKNTGSTSLGLAPVIVGPMYVFRNICSSGEAVIKLGQSSEGTIYFYHNTLYRSGSDHGIATYGGDAKVSNAIFRNNIIEVNGYDLEELAGGTGMMNLDYDSMYSTKEESIKWLNTRMTWAAWRTNYSQEPNGIWGQAAFNSPASGDFHLQSSSPCIDKGVVLTGFNDANSPWPYKGSEPDMGAYESAAPEFQTFTIRSMNIRWADSGTNDQFGIWGRLQLPDGVTPADLEKSAKVTISISGSSGNDIVNFNIRSLGRLGDLWEYEGSQQPPGVGMNVMKMTLWWAPQDNRWTGWAGFHIRGMLQLPESIGLGTQPAKAIVNVEIPVNGGGKGLIGQEAIEFNVFRLLRLWSHINRLLQFPFDLPDTE